MWQTQEEKINFIYTIFDSFFTNISYYDKQIPHPSNSHQPFEKNVIL